MLRENRWGEMVPSYASGHDQPSYGKHYSTAALVVHQKPQKDQERHEIQRRDVAIWSFLRTALLSGVASREYRDQRIEALGLGR
jgi:hypothetical protein